MGSNPHHEIAALDTTKPNVARVWDYWLGGKDNFAVDRDHAEHMLTINPIAAQMARENRQFLYRAVSYVTQAGIRQFIDVGAGLPTAVNTHEIAQKIAPDTKVAYLDHDPVVVRHAEALLAKNPGVIALSGDARDPGAILADEELNELIDFNRPVCVVLCGVLHFLDLEAARKTTAAFIDAVVPGSYAIFSVGVGDGELAEDFTAEYKAANLKIYTLEEFTSFFTGLELTAPGVVPAIGWTGQEGSPRLESGRATFLVGVGRKP
jgi:O-methyltransferase involved in polyketide biosynthesis